MATLLEKTRQINRLLQRFENVEYDGISQMLSNVLDANVYIANKRGKLQGYAFVDDVESNTTLDKIVSRGEFPRAYVHWMNRVEETSANRVSKSGKCAYEEKLNYLFDGKDTTLVPIYGVGERIGTLIVAKYQGEFNDDDLLLAEYGATVIGIEMLRDQNKKIEAEANKKATVQIALATLSFSEVEAAVNILGELDGKEGLLVASKIADRVGITRSVIVNALRKFESAGVIESKSLGMKGTYIKVLNEYLLDEVRKLKR